MPILVGESEEKGSKRCIDVKLVNKDQNYDPFYPIFRARIRLRSFCKKYFGYARNRARKHDKIFSVISNPGLARH